MPELPGKIQIGIYDGYCNLKCPMCLLHSPEVKANIGNLRGKMSLMDLCRILDEVKEGKPPITPHRWSEPLVNKKFSAYVKAIKQHGLPVYVNTNGLLLTKELAVFFVEIQLDSITFSIDALTPETLRLFRGTNDLDGIKSSVFMMLRARGAAEYPRIGVSFTLGEANRHEKDEFVNYWLEYVDVVRIIKLYEKDRSVRNIALPEKRGPCADIYNTMIIDYKGDVSICCLDALSQTNMGNVLRQGVKKVWHGEAFAQVRHYHETGQYDKLPLCKDCVPLSHFSYRETIAGDILTCQSPVMTFYNRLDRLDTWQERSVIESD